MIYSILFVDDDKSILKSIKREFFSSDYNVFFAEGGEEALKILYENKIDILITDIMMPQMDGHELLKKVKYLYPSIIRLVLSGYTDQKIVFKIINTNLAKTFLNKPWKENELIDTIEGIFHINEKLNNDYVKQIINSSNKLPTLPGMFSKINNLVEDDKSDIDDIIELINTDPVIASKILKVVNSAFYGVKTASIKTAVLKLGLENLKAVIITSEIFSSGDSYYEDLLWKHSNLTNKITSFIYQYIYNKKIPDNYSTAGLLHDLGKVVFLKMFEEKYEKVLRMKEEKPELSISSCESNVFNFSHEELGAIIFNYWDLPSAIVEVTLNHHNPMKSSNQFKDIVSIVHLADYFSWIGLNDRFLPEIKDEVFDYLGINKLEIEELIKNNRFEV